MKSFLFFAATMTALTACSLRPAPRPPVARYDLGDARFSESPAKQLPFVFVVHEPSAAAWLDTRDMHYRLEYEDGSRIRRYAGSRWAVSPLQLLGDLLRRRLALFAEKGAAVPDYGIEADYWLRPTIDEFSQVFDTPSASRGVVALRVVLLKGRNRSFHAQKSFRVEAPAPTPDAHGGVIALRTASAQACEAIVSWVAEETALASGAVRARPARSLLTASGRRPGTTPCR
ncbi:MAG: membrane integrity-associated transporter subunit PqiC [Vicinamibacteria bacterium]|nr:membrane integrity-associated transporter subunit PqiC [Vicinamibacteria bacterium]